MSDSTESYAALTAAVFPGARLARAWRIEGGVSAITAGLEVIHGDGRIERVVVRQLNPTSFKEHSEGGSVLEHRVVAAVHDLGLPVPLPQRVDTSCTVLPRPYVIYEFVSGSSSGPGRERIADAMAELLARVHDVSPDELPPGLPARESPLPELGTLVNASIAERARCVWRGDRTPTLLHGDFWPGNLLWRGDEVVALVDWEDAAIGDPLSDLACARVELRCATDALTMQRFTERYLAQTGVRSRDLVVWDIYVSAAALASMDDWGLGQEVLAQRKRRTQTFLEEARARLEAG